MDIKVELITPQKAQQWLASMGTNRNLRASMVEQIARDIRSGNWALNGESIKIDQDGRLVDGQHRLTAIIRSGRSVETVVVRGIGNDTVKTVDTGALRTKGDVLKMAGYPQSNSLGALIRAIKFDRECGCPFRGRSELSPTHNEVLDMAAELGDTMHQCIKVSRGADIKAIASCTVVAFFLFKSIENGLEDEAMRFIEHVATGHNLSKGHPALALRNRLWREATSPNHFYAHVQCALFIKTFAKFVNGDDVHSLRWSDSEEWPSFPKPKGATR